MEGIRGKEKEKRGVGGVQAKKRKSASETRKDVLLTMGEKWEGEREGEKEGESEREREGERAKQWTQGRMCKIKGARKGKKRGERGFMCTSVFNRCECIC